MPGSIGRWSVSCNRATRSWCLHPTDVSLTGELGTNQGGRPARSRRHRETLRPEAKRRPASQGPRLSPDQGAGLFCRIILWAAGRWFRIRRGGSVENPWPLSLDRPDRNKLLRLPDGSRRRLGRSACHDSLRIPEFWSWAGSQPSGLQQRRRGFSCSESA
jgi:hypothetical protein